jgi:hypothetical protein
MDNISLFTLFTENLRFWRENARKSLGRRQGANLKMTQKLKGASAAQERIYHQRKDLRLHVTLKHIEKMYLQIMLLHHM